MNGAYTLTSFLAFSKSETLPLSQPTETKLIISRIRRKRPSLRLIISSATLDASTFLDYFSSSPPQPFEATVLDIPGRMYPVEIGYLAEPTEDYVKEAVKVVWNLHLQSGGKGGAVEGDVLVFLTGREEIERALYEFSELLPRCVICAFIVFHFNTTWSSCLDFHPMLHE